MTRARELSKLANPEVFSVDSSNNVGINSLTPDSKLDVVGVVSATSFSGDGSQLTGIIAGATLSASNGTQRLVVTSQTTGSMTEAATNSDITYDTGTNTISATQFSGTLLGNATGLQGTPSITVQDITAETVSIAGTISYEDVSNVNSVGIITANKGIVVPAYGVVVTGVVTATSFISGGLEVSPSELIDSGSTTRVSVNTSGAVITGILTATAGAVITGILTATAGNDLNGYKVENGSISGSSINGVINYNLDDGHIQTYLGSTGGNYGPNFRVSGSKTLSSIMDVGDVVTTTLMVSSSSHYLTNGNIQIDGSTSNLDIDYVGGSAPSSANGSGYDIYSFIIQKTTSTPAYHIVVNALGAS